MIIYTDKRFFPYISATNHCSRLNQRIEGKPSPNPNPKVVRARLEKITYLCVRSDYVVVSRSQIAFARKKSGLKMVWLRETNYSVGLYHCAGRTFRRIGMVVEKNSLFDIIEVNHSLRMLLLISSTGSYCLALP